jgi:hypothetical protein
LKFSLILTGKDKMIIALHLTAKNLNYLNKLVPTTKAFWLD